MSPWLLALAAGLIIVLVQYGWRDLRAGWAVGAAALLRLVAITLLMALLLDAPSGPAKPVTNWAALDVSASMARGDTSLWRAARDSIAHVAAESVFAFGDSTRRADSASATRPNDAASLLRPAVERALGAGHPLTVVTDGELDDPEAVRALPAGSRIIAMRRALTKDVGLASIDVPRAIVSGDTVEAHVGIVAGNDGAKGGTITLSIDGRAFATQQIDSLPPFGERTVAVRARVEGPAGPAVLRAIVASGGDMEPRNDTVSIAVDLSRAPSAVFVSTSPDFDARYALAVLRGALGIPTRGFFRVAPGEWRVEGALTPIPEADVRQAVKEAPVAILHGDTAAFGPPRATTLGPLALIVTSPTEGEWYPSAAPPSPLAPALSGFMWDSLPPLALTPAPPQGTWQGMEARRGRGEERRAVLVGTDEPRRVVIVGASGLWRWRFRGGAASDAFTALWGSIFDWLAAERADRRAAVPDERVVRAGDPVRWRRGSTTDSLVTIALRRRGSTRVDSMPLHFSAGANIVETRPLAAGLYDVTTRGGAALLVVNASREWLPRSPRVQSGLVRGTVSADSAPRLRAGAWGWAYALAILLLCAEWIMRRRRGMR